MRIKKSALIVFSCLFTLADISSATAGILIGRGRVNMQGAITDSACAIAVNSREQVIDVHTVPLADIRRDGQGTSQSFSIDLVNCIFTRPGKADRKQFQVTFDGEADGALFGVQGEAAGVGLQIADPQGNIALPGQPMPAGNIPSGSLRLNYTLKLVANNRPLKSGGYSSFVRFRLDYF